MPTLSLSDWIQSEHLDAAARADLAARAATAPTRMLVLDNFLLPERYRDLQRVLREVGELRPVYALYGPNQVAGYGQGPGRGRVSREEWLAAPEQQRFFHHLEVVGPKPGVAPNRAWMTHAALRGTLSSPVFLDYFGALVGERLTGVERINGKILGDNQFLRPHTDVKPGRRFCAVLYLNDDWRPELEGRFLLYRDDREIDRVDPIGNRLLLFVPDPAYAHAVAPMSPAAAGWQRLNYTFWLSGEEKDKP